MDNGELEGGPLKSSWPGSHCAFQTVVVGGSKEKRNLNLTEKELKLTLIGSSSGLELAFPAYLAEIVKEKSQFTQNQITKED